MSRCNSKRTSRSVAVIILRLTHHKFDLFTLQDNKDKVKLNKQLPFLVANVVEIVEPYFDPNEEDGAIPTDLVPEGKGAVVKTSTRQTVFLPIPGLVRIAACEMKVDI